MSSGWWSGSAAPIPERPVPGMLGRGMQTAAAPADGPPDDPTTTIDCDRCSVRGDGCGDCVVTFLLGGPPPDAYLTGDQRQALDVLSDAGLVPPLRMVEVRIDSDPAQ